jgi:hypothetical protein
MKNEQSLHPQVKKILRSFGLKSITESSQSDDMRKATDFDCMWDGTNVKVACRLREGDYRDLTIREETESGHGKSELEKIRAGYVDYYFYGWVQDGKIIEWIFVDMGAMRESGLIDNPDGHQKSDVTFAYWNRDGALHKHILFEMPPRMEGLKNSTPSNDPKKGKTVYVPWTPKEPF